MFETVSSKVSSTISGNRRVLQMFFVALILLEFAPIEVLGPRVERSLKGVLDPIMNPVTNLMSNVFMRLVVFIVLLWSCCVRKDMNMFFLVSLYFVISRK
jgi:hypothetical protein